MSDKLLDCIGNNNTMLAVLHSWAQAGWIRWLDAELPAFLFREAQAAKTDVSPLLLLGAALCSHQNGHGHLCLDLQHCLQSPDKALLLPPEHAVATPDVTPGALLGRITLAQWQQAFTQSLLCSHVVHNNVKDNNNNSPLVICSDPHNTRLYLRRFWHYEQQLAKTVQQKLEKPVAVDESALKRLLDTLFQNSHQTTPAPTPDWQKIACALSVRSQFAIITGGPGTGKTTTVVKLLSLLQSLHRLSQQDSSDTTNPLRIKLAAPTGKAAARLSSSISSQLSTLDDADGIPHVVSTVHRLLGPVRHSRFFRYHKGNPLPADVVVIDEASMVDVELMAQLTDALPSDCRLILLGDKDQLASVEAGAVLGSLCSQANHGRYLGTTADWVTRVTSENIPAEYLASNGRQLDQVITMLRYSHRFGNVPGIGALASAVNSGISDTELQSLFSGQYSELHWIKLTSHPNPQFENLICDSNQGYGHYLALLPQHPALDAATEHWDNWANRMLTAHSTFQLLAALRKGDFGVEELNTRIKNMLARRGIINLPNTTESASDDVNQWYAGRPVMVTRNNYNLELMNGDIGIALPYPNPGAASGTTLRVAFRDNADPEKIRWILPTRLQEVETVFAMTVHKSQGSEFLHTALMLPAHDSPVLTRELIYTGITRASKRFTLICGDTTILDKAVQASVFRAGGLEDLLD